MDVQDVVNSLNEMIERLNQEIHWLRSQNDHLNWCLEVAEDIMDQYGCYDTYIDRIDEGE